MSVSATQRVQRSTPTVLTALLTVLLWLPVLAALAAPATSLSGRFGWMLATAFSGTLVAAGVVVLMLRHPARFGAPAATFNATSLGCSLILTVPVAAMVAFSTEGSYAAVALFFLVLWLLPVLLGTVAVLALTVFVVLGQAVHHGLGFGGVAGPAITAVVAICVMWGYRTIVRTSEANARLVAELQTAQSALTASEREAGRMAERSRLARDLHDTTAQSLSSIRLLAGSALSEHANAQVRLARLREIDHTAADALAQVRAIIADLTPPPLRDADLAAAITRIAERTGQLHGMHVSSSVTGAPWPLSMPASTALLRVAQEALGNAVAHAQASHTEVRLQFTPDAVALEVDDDGIGFDAAAWFAHPELAAERIDGSGTGLRGLTERLRAQGGFVSVVTEPGEGTLLRAELPRAMAERSER